MTGQNTTRTEETRRSQTGVASLGDAGASLPALRPYDLEISTDDLVLQAEKTLELRAWDHLALRVVNMRKAEAFYHELFQMDVLLRARRLGERWERLPADLDWDEAIRTGEYPDLTLLRHGPISLVLLNAGRGAVLFDPRLDHLSLRVSPGTLATLRATVLVRSFAVTRDEPCSFQFRDPFGITWHLTDDDV